MENAANAAAGKTGLASVMIEVLAPGDIAHIDGRIERQTRTLIFASADARDAQGARIASASSVHRILA